MSKLLIELLHNRTIRAILTTAGVRKPGIAEIVTSLLESKCHGSIAVFRMMSIKINGTMPKNKIALLGYQHDSEYSDTDMDDDV